MKIIDTHCHYNLEPLVTDWRHHWRTAQGHGVTHAVVIGTETETSIKAVELASSEPNLFAAIGNHPEVYQLLVEQKTESRVIFDLIQQHIHALETSITDKVIAIGEVGLDFFRLPLEAELAAAIKKAQIDAFIAHIQFAKEHRKPLILHVRDTNEEAYWTTLELLKEHFDLELPFVLHCVSGPTAYVETAIQMGAYVGVAANVTYKNADHIRNLVKLVPNDRLLLETDAPFLPPQAYRGKQCDPWMISLTAEYLGSMGISVEQVYKNAERVIRI